MSRTARPSCLTCVPLPTGCAGALVIAGLCVTPVALADTVNVSVYGKLHLSLDRSDNGGSDLANNLFVANNSSRLGFRGNEELGDGLKLLWQMESNVNANGDGNTLFGTSRDTYIGMSGDWGALLAGRLAAANDWLVGEADMFGDQVGSSGNFMAPGGWSADTGSNFRVNSALKYTAPRIGGFTLTLSHAMKSSAPIAESSNGMRLAYANGPLKASLTHWRFADGATTTPSATALGGAGDLGRWYITGQVVRFRDEAGNNTTIGIPGQNRTNWTAGGKFKVSAADTLKMQYARAGAASNQAESGANMIAVGYDHALSRRTLVYISYARAANDGGTAFGYSVYSNGKSNTAGDPVSGNDPAALSLGIVHDF
ncbi:MAG: hypothetical protein A2Z95_01720 [Gallionellales bacterium GWA2_60_18]|nr:MAG: hypothetical protein A2Z95_01720 [Gallionellales bacterium GWA2_60_18]